MSRVTHSTISDVLCSFALSQPIGQDESSGNIWYVHSSYRNSAIVFSKGKEKINK